MPKVTPHQIKISILWRLRWMYRQLFVPFIKRRISPSASIVCNNCFGSRISQDCGYRYNSPTAGLYICYPDYIDFLKNLRDAKSSPVAFYSHPSAPIGGGQNSIIGHLLLNGKDIEIHFLHYHSIEEAEQKWNRRCKRLNFDDLIVIGTEQNGCTEKDIIDFCQLPYKRKLFICKNKYPNITSPCLFYAKAMSRDGFTDLYDMAHVCYRRLCKL